MQHIAVKERMHKWHVATGLKNSTSEFKSVHTRDLTPGDIF